MTDATYYYYYYCYYYYVASVVSESVRPHRQQPTRLLCPWDSPGKNNGVGCHFLFNSLEGLMLKLKLQYFGHLIQRADSFEKTMMLGKIEGGRRRGQQIGRAHV